MQDNNKYWGMRGLLLTRVSTGEQAKKYSHDAQERKIRQLLIEPLGIRIMDEARHIIHDTYTGLEYRYRQALEDILEMAERGEFDVLLMDVLDRGLGRKALAREMFRMQLRELGVRILTTDPSDHADDDSLEGQIMRFHKGIKAEEEILDLVRRTSDGRRQKALGNAEKGIPGRIVGNSTRLYGFRFLVDEHGDRIGYELNVSVVHVEANGTEWTEVSVIRFIFEQAADGVSTYQICRILNQKGIPSPFVTKGMRHKKVTEPPTWQPQVIGRMIRNTAYFGEYRQFRTAPSDRKPGKKTVRRKTSSDEQIIIPVPAIVTKDLFDQANTRVKLNKQLATRNNQTSKEALLRGGFAKCGYCGTTLRVFRKCETRKSGKEVTYFSYNCSRPYNTVGLCKGCSIPVDMLDAAAWEEAVKIIRDPSELDRKIADILKQNSATQQRKRALKTLNAILSEEETYRANLDREMRKKILSERTVAYLQKQLTDLERQEQEARKNLADEQTMQLKQEKLERRIAEFHQQCQLWRENLDDPQFTLSFKFKHDAILFFGITATVWKSDHRPRYVFHKDPPEIVELLS
jgi:site-specific DNA recombinase